MLMFSFLIVGLVASLIVGFIRKNQLSDLVGYLVVGLTGSVSGGMIFGTINPSSQIGAIAASAGGAILLLLLVEFVKKD